MRNNAPKSLDERENIEDFLGGLLGGQTVLQVSLTYLQGAPPRVGSDGMRKGAMKKVNR